MTTVTLNRKGNTYSIEAKGHATGSEVVCASISTLIYSLKGYLINSDLEVLEDITKPGYAKVTFSGDGDKLYKFMDIAFHQLELKEKDFIKIK